MKVIYGIGNYKLKIRPAVLVIGVFDGLHRGHQQLIRKAVRRSEAISGQTIVMTFWPHPIHVLHPEIKLPLITSLTYRLKLLSDLGVTACLVVRFTPGFARSTPAQFIQKYLVNGLKPGEVFVGDDFRFGQNRSGGLEFFQEEGRKHGFKVHALRSVRAQAGSVRKIGSTLIRQLIAEGKLNKAKILLGRPFAIMGKVVRGDARGKTLGFPTANIHPVHEIIPPLGVYAVEVEHKGKRYGGMADVGLQPSFRQSNEEVNIEVHIFDFNKNLYGEEIIVSFIKKIRDEKVFYLKEELVVQLKKDEKTARNVLAL